MYDLLVTVYLSIILLKRPAIHVSSKVVQLNDEYVYKKYKKVFIYLFFFQKEVNTHFFKKS